MKRNILALATVLGGLTLAAPEARADHGWRWGFSLGFGFGGGHVRSVVARPFCPPVVVAPVVHVHHRVPIYREVWVPARCREVFVGYNWFGVPIYRSECVSSGHYESVVVGYRCDGCGCPF
jgi:hypothetical protein